MQVSSIKNSPHVGEKAISEIFISAMTVRVTKTVLTHVHAIHTIVMTLIGAIQRTKIIPFMRSQVWNKII